MVSEKIETDDALAQLTRNIYTNIERKNKTIGIFIDLSKAFDSISDNQLLNIFKSIGIVHKHFNLLKSYLEHRKQIVRISNTFST